MNLLEGLPMPVLSSPAAEAETRHVVVLNRYPMPPLLCMCAAHFPPEDSSAIGGKDLAKAP